MYRYFIWKWRPATCLHKLLRQTINWSFIHQQPQCTTYSHLRKNIYCMMCIFYLHLVVVLVCVCVCCGAGVLINPMCFLQAHGALSVMWGHDRHTLSSSTLCWLSQSETVYQNDEQHGNSYAFCIPDIL